MASFTFCDVRSYFLFMLYDSLIDLKLLIRQVSVAPVHGAQLKLDRGTKHFSCFFSPTFRLNSFQ